MVHKCKECGTNYKVNPCRDDKTFYCSRKCANTGIARRPVTWGAKIGAKIKGNKRPDLSEYNKIHKKIGHQNYLYKGHKAGYTAKHTWVRRWFGAPEKCAKCGSVKNLQWANKSGRYFRIRKDWIALCAKCHYHFDIKRHQRK